MATSARLDGSAGAQMLLEHDVANFKDDAGLRAFVSSVQQAATLFHRAALGCSIKYATLGTGGCTMVAYSGWGIACDHHHRYATSGCADDLPTTCSWRPRRGHANPPAPCVCRADQEVTVGKGMRVG